MLEVVDCSVVAEAGEGLVSSVAGEIATRSDVSAMAEAASGPGAFVVAGDVSPLGCA
jgi:hypothetical protein